MYNIHQKNNKAASRFLMIITFILNFITIVIVASPNAFAEYQEIYNKSHMLQLKSDNRTIKTERITTVGELDTGENKFRFTFYTKDFDKQDWSKEEKRIPLHIRHTNTAPQYMGIIIFHSENVKVLESKQKGFLVRDSMFSKKYGWEELLPYKDHRNAQLAMGVGEKVIDKLLSKIPFAKEGYKQLVEYCAKQNKRYYESIFKEKENYVATMLPLHIPKDIIGFTETARSIEIPFDLSAAQGEQKISFWINPAFGNPSVNSTTGFGRLEGLIINFNLSIWNIENIRWLKREIEIDRLKNKPRYYWIWNDERPHADKSFVEGRMFAYSWWGGEPDEIRYLNNIPYLYDENINPLDSIGEFYLDIGVSQDGRTVIIDLTCDSIFKKMWDKSDIAIEYLTWDRNYKKFRTIGWNRTKLLYYKKRFVGQLWESNSWHIWITGPKFHSPLGRGSTKLDAEWASEVIYKIGD